MGKPVLPAELTTFDGKKVKARILIDSGSFFSLIREDILPKDAEYTHFHEPGKLGTAAKGTSIALTGAVELIVETERKQIVVGAFVSPDMKTEMIIGAREMQAWDISVTNIRGKTYVHIGHDRRDEDINTVL